MGPVGSQPGTFGPVGAARLRGIVGDVERDREGLGIIGREECLRLLSAAPIGRIAVSRDALPSILPVNFVLRDEAVLFASGSGSKALAVAHGDVIAFEVDDFEVGSRTGWSVLVVGRAEEVDRREREWADVGDALQPWVGRWASYLFRLPTVRMTGRQVGLAPEG